MTRFTKIAALLLVALWLPATLHCELETLPGFEFLSSCCGGDDAAQPPSGCQDDSCGAVESGLCKIEDNPTITVGLPALLVLAAWDFIAQPPDHSRAQTSPASPAPPELPRVWRFSCRAALPPRAPSILA